MDLQERRRKGPSHDPGLGEVSIEAFQCVGPHLLDDEPYRPLSALSVGRSYLERMVHMAMGQVEGRFQAHRRPFPHQLKDAGHLVSVCAWIDYYLV